MRSKPDSSSSSERPDGRRPLLVYLDPKLIQALKIEALEKHTHVYLLVEEILRTRADERNSLTYAESAQSRRKS